MSDLKPVMDELRVTIRTIRKCRSNNSYYTEGYLDAALDIMRLLEPLCDDEDDGLLPEGPMPDV